MRKKWQRTNGYLLFVNGEGPEVAKKNKKYIKNKPTHYDNEPRAGATWWQTTRRSDVVMDHAPKRRGDEPHAGATR